MQTPSVYFSLPLLSPSLPLLSLFLSLFPLSSHLHGDDAAMSHPHTAPQFGLKTGEYGSGEGLCCPGNRLGVPPTPHSTTPSTPTGPTYSEPEDPRKSVPIMCLCDIHIQNVNTQAHIYPAQKNRWKITLFNADRQSWKTIKCLQTEHVCIHSMWCVCMQCVRVKGRVYIRMFALSKYIVSW